MAFNLPCKRLQAGDGFGNKSVGWVLPECLGGVELDRNTIDEHQDTIGHCHGFFGIVGHHNRRCACLNETSSSILPKLTAKGSIDAGEGLIQQHHSGIGGQCPDQRDSLLLASGQRIRVAGRQIDQPNAVEQLIHLAVALRRWNLLEAKADVLRHGEMREQRMVLKN